MLRALLLAGAAGIALGESGPPREVGEVAFLYGAALMLGVDPFVTSRSVGRGFAVGLVSGLGFGVSALGWVAPALARFSAGHAWLGAPSVVGVTLLSALAPAFGCALYVAAARERGDALRFAAALALAFTAVPMLFPYRPIAMALPLLPVGAWLGVGGATLADFLVAFPVCAAVVASSRGDRSAFVRSVAFLAVVWFGGELEFRRVEHQRATLPILRLGLVQSDVSVAIGRDRTQREARLDRLRTLTASFAGTDVASVLWPESAYPFAIDRATARELPTPRDVGAARYGLVVAVGATTVGEGCAHWNSVVVYDRRGRLLDVVDKERRMPFADASPWTLLRRPRARRCGELAPAVSVAPLRSLAAAGALVCYDEVEPWVALERTHRGATYLVGFTNDAWYAGTRQPALHERVARMRAIETGRDLVRVVNGGPSSHVSASGRFVARIEPGREATRTVSVRTQRQPTLYGTMGFGFDAAFALVFLAASVQRRRTSSSGGGR